MNSRQVSFTAILLAAGCVGWCCFVDLRMSIVEFCRDVAGATLLWTPVGGVVYLLLRDRVVDGISRFTISWVASYTLTTALCAACGALGVVAPGANGLFYVAQALMLAGSAYYIWRNGVLGRRRAGAETPATTVEQRRTRPLIARALSILQWPGWERIDGVLVLLVAFSVLLGSRYKHSIQPLDDGGQRVVVHGDATYLASLSCELARHCPPLEQCSRAGLKERAYHMFPHLTTTLIARYTGQPDMLRALTLGTFTFVEILLCLVFYSIGRLTTGSRGAGYFCCALVYLLAIPQLPLVRDHIGYFYFTWHPHATSGLEPSALCSPQTYCALPAMLGALLLVLQLSLQLSQRRAAGLVAILTALVAASLLRFRVQTFLILFPGVMLYLTYVWCATRRRVYGLAVGLGALLVGAQFAEMRMDVYYPDSANLVIENNMLAHRSLFMVAWPGAETIRAALQGWLSRGAFLIAWQVVGLSGFVLFSICGLPVSLAAIFHFARPASWRAASSAYTATLLWMIVGTVLGGCCLCTTYDVYSVGGQSLYLAGWYLLPLVAISLWQAGELVPRRLRPPQKYLTACGGLLLVAAGGWQLRRPESLLQYAILHTPTILSPDEWQAMMVLRDQTPTDAVVLFNIEHLTGNSSILSSITGRRTFFEYLCMTRFLTGGHADNNEGRLARRERVWQADNVGEFVAAMSDTGAEYLLEYERLPLKLHPPEALEAFWSSPTGAVKIWRFRPREVPSPGETARR